MNEEERSLILGGLVWPFVFLLDHSQTSNQEKRRSSLKLNRRKATNTWHVSHRVSCRISRIKLLPIVMVWIFRTIALLLDALRDLIVGYSKSSSASVKCRREIFGRANFHANVVSSGINVSSKVGDDERRTGEGTEPCRPAEKTPRHYSLDFSTSISSISFILTCWIWEFCC